ARPPSAAVRARSWHGSQARIGCYGAERRRRPPARRAARAARPTLRRGARAESQARHERAPAENLPRAREPERVAPGARLRRPGPAGPARAPPPHGLTERRDSPRPDGHVSPGPRGLSPLARTD